MWSGSQYVEMHTWFPGAATELLYAVIEGLQFYIESHTCGSLAMVKQMDYTGGKLITRSHSSITQVPWLHSLDLSDRQETKPREANHGGPRNGRIKENCSLEFALASS